MLISVNSDLSLNELVECVDNLETFCREFSKVLWENYYLTDSKNGDPNIGKLIDINYDTLDQLVEFRKLLDLFNVNVEDLL